RQGLWAAVEARRHEMVEPALGGDAPLARVDAGGGGQQVEAIFDQPEALRVGQFLVAVVGDPVELEQPRTVAFTGLRLSRVELAGLRIPRQNGLGPGAAGGGAHAQDVLKRSEERRVGTERISRSPPL